MPAAKLFGELTRHSMTTADQLRMNRLTHARSMIQERFERGEIFPEEAEQLIGQVEQSQGPLQEKQQREIELANEAKTQAMIEETVQQNQLANAITADNMETLPERVGVVKDPATGQPWLVVPNEKGVPTVLQPSGGGQQQSGGQWYSASGTGPPPSGGPAPAGGGMAQGNAMGTPWGQGQSPAGQPSGGQQQPPVTGSASEVRQAFTWADSNVPPLPPNATPAQRQEHLQLRQEYAQYYLREQQAMTTPEAQQGPNVVHAVVGYGTSDASAQPMTSTGRGQSSPGGGPTTPMPGQGGGQGGLREASWTDRRPPNPWDPTRMTEPQYRQYYSGIQRELMESSPTGQQPTPEQIQAEMQRRMQNHPTYNHGLNGQPPAVELPDLQTMDPTTRRIGSPAFVEGNNFSVPRAGTNPVWTAQRRTTMQTNYNREIDNGNYQRAAIIATVTRLMAAYGTVQNAPPHMREVWQRAAEQLRNPALMPGQQPAADPGQQRQEQQGDLPQPPAASQPAAQPSPLAQSTPPRLFGSQSPYGLPPEAFGN